MSQKRYENGKDGKLEFRDAPIAPLEQGFVRIEPKAFAVNPIDFKVLKFQVAIGSGAGCDFAGVVTEVGPGVSSVKVGDTVAGGAPGNDPDNLQIGAFGETLTLQEDSLYKFDNLKVDLRDSIPQGKVESFEQASSLGIGVGTSIVATELYSKVPFKKNSASGWALVYGAAGSLGWYTTQVYQYMGYEVIAVASAKHKEAFKAIGVKHLVDYHDEDWPEQVRELTSDGLTLAFDTITLGETTKQIGRALSSQKPAQIILSLGTPKENLPTAENVRVDHVMWFSFWNTLRRIGPMEQHTPAEFVARRGAIFDEINKFLPTLVSLPISVSGQGLEAIPAAYKRLEGGVSLEKVVVRI